MLHALKKLIGIKLGQRGTKTTVIAYADEVTVIVSNPENICNIEKILSTYEKATGSKMNTRKSRAIAL
jgi:hypothetical protein